MFYIWALPECSGRCEAVKKLAGPVTSFPAPFEVKGLFGFISFAAKFS
jgi:hypothetical protein